MKTEGGQTGKSPKESREKWPHHQRKKRKRLPSLYGTASMWNHKQRGKIKLAARLQPGPEQQGTAKQKKEGQERERWIQL